MPGVVALTIIFAPTPCTLHANNIVDLNSKLGHDLYNKAISTITIPFDRNSKNINLSQSQLLRRFENSGWNIDTGDILTVTDGDGVDRKVIWMCH